MTLEIELHAVPYLKGLINVSNISGWQARGSMDSIHQAKLKTTHFTPYRANRTDTFLPDCMLKLPTHGRGGAKSKEIMLMYGSCPKLKITNYKLNDLNSKNIKK